MVLAIFHGLQLFYFITKIIHDYIEITAQIKFYTPNKIKLVKMPR